MWLLHLLSDGVLEYIVNGILILGIMMTLISFFALNYILRLIPGLSVYHTSIQVASVLILTAGVYFKGGLSTELIWRQKVEKVQKELDIANSKAKEKIIEVQEKVVYRDRIIKERGEDLIKFIDREIVKKEKIIKYIEQCPVPNELIEIHNQAAKLNSNLQGHKK